MQIYAESYSIKLKHCSQQLKGFCNLYISTFLNWKNMHVSQPVWNVNLGFSYITSSINLIWVDISQNGIQFLMIFFLLVKGATFIKIELCAAWVQIHVFKVKLCVPVPLQKRSHSLNMLFMAVIKLENMFPWQQSLKLSPWWQLLA